MSLLITAFRLHDWASALLARHFLWVKKSLLIVAHLSLLGFLFPELRRNFGSAAEIMLLAILFLSPISKILGMRFLLQLMALRREMGIMMGYLATVHGLGYLIDPAWSTSIISLFQETGLSGASAPYFLGMMAYMITLPLLFTSNAWAQRALGGINWKRLHRTVYVILPLVLVHHFSIRRGLSFFVVVQATFYTLLYIFAKIIAWKNTFPPLRRVIEAVATAYRNYVVLRKAEASLH